MKRTELIATLVGAILIALSLSCDDPVAVNERPNDNARLLFTIEGSGVDIFDPSPSPDGNSLAFCYRINNVSAGSRSAVLALYNLNTGGVTDLLIGDANYTDYRHSMFSRDSTRIMYGVGWQIYIYTLSDDSVKQVTLETAMYLPVDWGPTGDTVIVREIRDGGSTSLLHEIDIDTLEQTYLFTATGADFQGKFSPTHDRFLATWDYQLGLDNYIEIRLYDTATWEYEILFENVEYGYARSGGWSSDGNKVLLVYKPEYDEYIVVYDLVTEEIKYATWTPRDEQGYYTNTVYYPVWSADEEQIYYQAGSSSTMIWVVDSP